MSTGFTDEQELLKLANKTILLFFFLGFFVSSFCFGVYRFCYSPMLSVGCELHGFRCGVRLKKKKGFILIKGFFVRVSNKYLQKAL